MLICNARKYFKNWKASLPEMLQHSLISRCYSSFSLIILLLFYSLLLCNTSLWTGYLIEPFLASHNNECYWYSFINVHNVLYNIWTLPPHCPVNDHRNCGWMVWVKCSPQHPLGEMIITTIVYLRGCMDCGGRWWATLMVSWNWCRISPSMNTTTTTAVKSLNHPCLLHLQLVLDSNCSMSAQSSGKQLHRINGSYLYWYFYEAVLCLINFPVVKWQFLLRQREAYSTLAGLWW